MHGPHTLCMYYDLKGICLSIVHIAIPRNGNILLGNDIYILFLKGRYEYIIGIRSLIICMYVCMYVLQQFAAIEIIV